jgi:hypothetical protein
MFGRKDKRQAEAAAASGIGGSAAGDFLDDDAIDPIDPTEQVTTSDGRVIEIDTDEVSALYDAIITGTPAEKAAAEARLREIEAGS